MQVLTGRINDRIVQTRDYTPINIHSPAKVDCAYLITTGNSHHVPSQIARLCHYARNVVVLCTMTPARGIEQIPKDVVLIPFLGEIQDRFVRRPSSINPTLRWNRQFDIPTKRTFAIGHAIDHGFETALLIDDDVCFSNTFVSSAVHLLRNGVDIACSYCLEDADVSTLDRLHCRLTGENAEVSIGGNAVVLRIGPKLAFFPYIYNEDWLFLWASMRYGGATLMPFQNVRQMPRREGRESLVAMEQFGEVITFALFYQDGTPDLSLLRNLNFARDCLRAYRAQIVELQSHDKSSAAIFAALCAVDEITPSDVTNFAENLTHELEGHYEAGIRA